MLTGSSISAPKVAKKVDASLPKARRNRWRETRSPTPGRPWRRISVQTAGPRSNPRYLRHSRQRRLPITFRWCPDLTTKAHEGNPLEFNLCATSCPSWFMKLGQNSLSPPLLSLTNQWYCSMCKPVFWDEVLAAHRYPTSRTVAGFRSSHRHPRRGAVRPPISLAGSCSGHSLNQSDTRQRRIRCRDYF